jgi:hypothetical protein
MHIVKFSVITITFHSRNYQVFNLNKCKMCGPLRLPLPPITGPLPGSSILTHEPITASGHKRVRRRQCSRGRKEKENAQAQ